MASFNLDDSDLKAGITIFEQRVMQAIKVYGETTAKDFESYAKANRPWTDRTSRARQGLKGYTEDNEKGIDVCIAHTVDYGKFLEYAHEKRFAILWPTVRKKSNDVLKGFKTMFSKIRVK